MSSEVSSEVKLGSSTTTVFSVTVVYDGENGECHGELMTLFVNIVEKVTDLNAHYDTTRGERPVTLESTMSQAKTTKWSITPMEDF